MFLTENVVEDFCYNLTYFSRLDRTGSKTNETKYMVILNTFFKTHFALWGTWKCPLNAPLVGILLLFSN